MCSWGCVAGVEKDYVGSRIGATLSHAEPDFPPFVSDEAIDFISLVSYDALQYLVVPEGSKQCDPPILIWIKIRMGHPIILSASPCCSSHRPLTIRRP